MSNAKDFWQKRHYSVCSVRLGLRLGLLGLLLADVVAPASQCLDNLRGNRSGQRDTEENERLVNGVGKSKFRPDSYSAVSCNLCTTLDQRTCSGAGVCSLGFLEIIGNAQITTLIGYWASRLIFVALRVLL